MWKDAYYVRMRALLFPASQQFQDGGFVIHKDGPKASVIPTWNYFEHILRAFPVLIEYTFISYCLDCYFISSLLWWGVNELGGKADPGSFLSPVPYSINNEALPPEGIVSL